jgi:transketolase
MGLEDIAMFRTVLDSVILYPSDAVSTERLVEEAAKHRGMVYIRTTRGDTPILYGSEEQFPIGGCKVLRQSRNDIITLIAAGTTLHEALAAHEELKSRNIPVRVMDLYCIQPMDAATVRNSAQETMGVITIEDHFAQGGLGEAVMSVLAHETVPVHSLAVRKMPRSGKPMELLEYEEISRNAIVRKVMEIVEAKNAGSMGKRRE